MINKDRALDTSNALRVLAAALAPHLLELLDLSTRIHSDDWVDVAAQLPTCKRALYKACRTGALPARRVKRVWLARRVDLDAWVESHDTGVKPAPAVTPNRVLTPAEEHERETDALLEKMGLRRRTDAERAALGLPPYDVDREYEEHLKAEKEREERRASKERDDANPQIAAARAAAIREVDEARLRRPAKLPRIRCNRCGRVMTRRRDGGPISHPCPRRHGYGCSNASGNSDYDGTVKCPWCAERKSDQLAEEPGLLRLSPKLP
jgi:hypothetical protein